MNSCPFNQQAVARSTRAWIETPEPEESSIPPIVARSTRAWIETDGKRRISFISASHALRVRGLKLALFAGFPGVRWSHALRVRGLKRRVSCIRRSRLRSHALRVRGLKRLVMGAADESAAVARSTRAWIETAVWSVYPAEYMSHALRVRGLKPRRLRTIHSLRLVARSTRAWIETSADSGNSSPAAVARSTRAWIETGQTVSRDDMTNCRTLYACVD